MTFTLKLRRTSSYMKFLKIMKLVFFTKFAQKCAQKCAVDLKFFQKRSRTKGKPVNSFISKMD